MERLQWNPGKKKLYDSSPILYDFFMAHAAISRDIKIS